MRVLTWRDIDFRTQVVRVTGKPLYGFKPKNKEEREVPVPASLIATLKKYKAAKKPNVDSLVFPNESGRPDKRHEFKLKRVAFHAKLNCGQCVTKHGNKCVEGPYCSNFFLHKFRHTFATRNLQDHVCDIKTWCKVAREGSRAARQQPPESIRRRAGIFRFGSKGTKTETIAPQ